jgi:hypothetical protein
MDKVFGDWGKQNVALFCRALQSVDIGAWIFFVGL